MASESRSMGVFYPLPYMVPGGLRTERLVLRPLRATDVEWDYDAVMSSAPELRCWSQSNWPSDDFTLAENLADLERHEREHEAREAFTYTVLDSAERRCLGCVYITPPQEEEIDLCAAASRPACVGFWVRTGEIARGLDRHLLSTLIQWLRRDWSFDAVLFTNAADERRQAALLAELGLDRSPVRWRDGRTGWVFRASLRC